MMSVQWMNQLEEPGRRNSWGKGNDGTLNFTGRRAGALTIIGPARHFSLFLIELASSARDLNALLIQDVDIFVIILSSLVCTRTTRSVRWWVESERSDFVSRSKVERRRIHKRRKYVFASKPACHFPFIFPCGVGLRRQAWSDTV